MSEFNDKEGYLMMDSKCRKRFKQHEFLGVPTTELSQKELKVTFGALLAERNSLARQLHFYTRLDREQKQRLANVIRSDFELTMLVSAY